MKDKKNLSYAIIIVALVATLGVLWLLIIDTANNDYIAHNSDASTMNSGNSSVIYSAVKEITESVDIDGGEFSSTNVDENAISVSGDIAATIANISVTKTGDSDGGDNTSFYGTNSAIIAKGGATLTIKNANITTDATGANGVFSYGGSAITNNSFSDGTTVNISDSIITTIKDNSGEVALALDSSSTLTLTGDTYVKSLANADATDSNINLNGYKLYVNGVALK